MYVAYGPELLAVDVVEEEQVWSFVNEDQAAPFFAPPATSDNLLVIGDYGASGGFFSPGVIVTVYGVVVDGNNPDVIWSENTVATDRIIAQPLLIDDRAYIGTADNDVVALDANTGEVLWRFQLGHSIWAQPLFHEGMLYVSSLDKSLHALDAETGEEIWARDLNGAAASSPIIHDGILYVGSFSSELHAIAAETGEELWGGSGGRLGLGWPSPSR